MRHEPFLHFVFIIVQQTAQGPKVKAPPPVPPKPKIGQLQSTRKASTAAPRSLKMVTRTSSITSSSKTQTTLSVTIPTATNLKATSRPLITGATSRHHITGATSRHHITGATSRPLITGATSRHHITGATSRHHITGATSRPSSLEQPQDHSSEYITLREMLADLVDLLAGNAPVITQLSTHLFSPGLIPEAVHICAETTGLSPYDRAHKIFFSVLATLKSHPNPNSVFTSLITALHKTGSGFTIIATKLTDTLSKRHYF